MTRKEFVTRSINSLSEFYSLPEARAMALRVILHFLHLSEYEYLIDSAVAIPKSDLLPLEKAIEELTGYKPLQYVLGYQEFAGHRFDVNESVLIPRPETEQMFKMICEDWKDAGFQELRVFDACTGSGCLAWSIAAEFPKTSVFACDLSEDALRTASCQNIYSDENSRQLIKNPPYFFKWDILEGPPDEKERKKAGEFPDLGDLDIFVSNPPYVCERERDFMSPNVLDWEPDMALFVPDDDPLRFYRASGNWITAYLRTGGRAYFEINESYGRQCAELFESLGLSEVTLHEDFRGKPRFISLTKWF